MAIVKGVNEGDYLLKYRTTQQRHVRNPMSRNYEFKDVEVYFALRLTTRRARTNGATISQGWMKVFMDALKIKTQPISPSGNGQPRWIAVGTDLVSVTKEQWEELDICEVAESRYQKYVQNESLSFQILIDTKELTSKDIQGYRMLTSDDVDSDVWPAEPQLTSIPAYSLQTGQRVFQ